MSKSAHSVERQLNLNLPIHPPCCLVCTLLPSHPDTRSQWPVNALYFTEYFNFYYGPGRAAAKKASTASTSHEEGGDYGSGKYGGGYGGGYGAKAEEKLAVALVLYGEVEGEGDDGNLYRGIVTAVLDLYTPLDNIGDLAGALLGGLLNGGGGGGGTPPPKVANPVTQNPIFVGLRNILYDKLRLHSMSETGTAPTVVPQVFHFELENMGPINEENRKKLAKQGTAAKKPAAAAPGSTNKSA